MSLSGPAFSWRLYLSEKWDLLQMELNQLSHSETLSRLIDPLRACVCVCVTTRGKTGRGVSSVAMNKPVKLATTLLIAGLN